MSVHLSANTRVVEDLLRRFAFTTYSAIVAARLELGAQIRLSMQHPETYNIPIDQALPESLGREATAQYVHPWNVACALMNVCVNGQRFGGENLAPQDDLQVFVGEWKPLMGCTYPSAVVPLPEPAAPAPAPAPVAFTPPPPAPAPAPAAVAPPAADPEPVAAPAVEAAPGPTPVGNVAGYGELPDPSITLERTGQSGRPQKSPFEKKMEERNKVADPPFWWSHMLVSAPKLLVESPAGALDDSSTGTGPVQSYMLLIGLVRKVLAGAPAHATAADIDAYLQSIDAQVSRLPTAAAANQLRTALMYR